MLPNIDCICAPNRTVQGRLLLLLGITAAVVPAQGQVNSAEPLFEFKPLEVTGTRLPEDIQQFRTEWVVEGVGAAEETRPLDTWAALARLPELHVEQPGGLAGNSVLYLRGGEPNFTKVLIDGIEVNNPNSSRGGTYNFNSISLAGLSRISVLGGAQSAIYGSDALSGVVDIQTMNLEIPAPGLHSQLDFEAGELDYLQANASAGYASQIYHLAGHVGRLEERNGLTGESFEAWRWNSGMVLSTGPRLLLFLSAIGSQIERQHYPDDSGGWLYAVSDELDTNRSQDTGAQVTGRFQLAEATELIARGSWYRLEEADTSPGVPPGERDPFGIPANIFDNVLERKRAQGYIRHLFAPGFAVVAGAEFTDEIGTSVSLVSYPFGQIPGTYELQTKTNSLFTETAFTPLPGHQADLAVRWDDIDRIGTVRTSRASYQVDLPSLQASIRLAYGEGFKKPSLFALGNPLVGNPGLRPEESDLLELNINWQSAEGRVGSRLTVFTQDFTDLIDLSESAPPKLVNLQSVQSDGISAAVYYRHERVEELSLHVTWLDVEVKDSEELLRNRPKWKAGLSATIRIADEVFVDFHTLYIGERQDSSIPTGTLTLDDYFQTDLGLRWQLRQGLWASVIIENLWDTKYEATVGMPDPGRRVRAGIRWIY